VRRKRYEVNKDQFGALFLRLAGREILVYVIIDRATGSDIYTLALSVEGKPNPFLHSLANETAPAVSPRWEVAGIRSDGSGRRKFTHAFFRRRSAVPGFHERRGKTGLERDGKEIYYREALRMMAVK